MAAGEGKRRWLRAFLLPSALARKNEPAERLTEQLNTMCNGCFHETEINVLTCYLLILQALKGNECAPEICFNRRTIPSRRPSSNPSCLLEGIWQAVDYSDLDIKARHMEN